MTQTTPTIHPKPSVLEGAVPGQDGPSSEEAETQAAKPCRLLTPDGVPAPSAPPEDESADPVGDGHSDAEFADQHRQPKRG